MTRHLDLALERFAATDLEYARGGYDGLSNHGPMAAEALEALGFPEAIPGFTEAYLPQLRPFVPESGEGAAVALGRASDGARWVRHFEVRLGQDPWREVVRSAAPSLVPGIGAAAFHGLLRTAHAVRGLLRAETSARRRELAFGLGYWASRHQTFSGSPGRSPSVGLGPSLAALPLVRAAERVTGGLITERFGALEGRADFIANVEAIDVGDDLDAALTELSAIAARIVLAAPPSTRFTYLHAFTGTAAVRLLLPLLEPDVARDAVGHLYQAVAAVHATHAAPDTLAKAQALGVGPVDDPAELAARASRSLDDHTIKFVEAAVREHAVDPRPEYLVAARARLTG